MERVTREQLLSARAAGTPVVLATALDDGEQHLFHADSAPQEMAAAVADALRFDRADSQEIAGRRWFLNPFNPPLRLFLVGAVHIAQSLAPLAAATEFDVTVIDPRRAFATPERFPGVTLDTAWPDEALAAHAPDARTAIVTLTHDPKLDDPALATALGSPAFYVGALGSRRTHAARRERLTQMGFTAADIDRIHAPVGFSIGARGPAEIAISVLAQAISVLRTGE